MVQLWDFACALVSCYEKQLEVAFDDDVISLRTYIEQHYLIDDFLNFFYKACQILYLYPL